MNLHQTYLIVSKKSGFSLVDLMVVVVIIGVLAAVALPSYNQYAKKAKKAEAYEILSVMMKSQRTYHSENGVFHKLSLNAGNHSGPDDFTFQRQSDWDEIGYPAPLETKLNFAYGVTAGGFDSAGTLKAPIGNNALVDPGDESEEMAAAITYGDSGDRSCDMSGAIPSDFGILSSGSSYDWAVLIAKGNLQKNPETACSFVLQRVTFTPDASYVASGFVEWDSNL